MSSKCVCVCSYAGADGQLISENNAGANLPLCLSESQPLLASSLLLVKVVLASPAVTRSLASMDD